MNYIEWLKQITGELRKQKHLFSHIPRSELTSNWQSSFRFHLKALENNLENQKHPFSDKDKGFLRFYPVTLLSNNKEKNKIQKKLGLKNKTKNRLFHSSLKPNVLIKNGKLSFPRSSSFSIECSPLWAMKKRSSCYSFVEKQLSQKKGTFFFHLSNALPTVGWVLNVSSQQKKEEVFHIHYDFDDDSSKIAVEFPLWNLRNFIFLKKNTKMLLLESFSTRGSHFINYSTSLHISAHGECNWLRLEDGEKEHSFFLEQSDAQVDRGGSFHRISLQDSFYRASESLKCQMSAEGARTELMHLSLLEKQQKATHKFVVNHGVRACLSRQYSRSIVRDEAKVDFHGKVSIEQKGSKSDCLQSAKAFLLDKKAKASMRPVLKVFNQDVKAKHGASTYRINDEESFYLSTRGLNKRQIREIFIYAFLKEAWSRCPIFKLENSLEPYFFNKITKNDFRSFSPLIHK